MNKVENEDKHEDNKQDHFNHDNEDNQYETHNEIHEDKFDHESEKSIQKSEMH